MTKTIENFFIITATFTPALPVIFFFIFYKSLKTQKVIFYLATYSFAELIVNVIAYNATKLPIFLYPLFTIIEYSLFAAILYFLIESKTVRIIVNVVSVVFILFSIIYYFTVKVRGLDTIPIGIESFFILLYCFFFLYEEMQIDSQQLIYNRYSFWIIAGMMIYLGGSSFIYLFANQVDNETMHIFWTFQNAFAILKNFLFMISIYICYRNTKNLKKSVYKLA